MNPAVLLPPTNLTATDAVFEHLLCDIVSGTYKAEDRLPAERELAKKLGCSRPTLREALRRLGEWNLVKPRRGSGVVVQPLSDWMLDVVPAYLRYAKPGESDPSISLVVQDLLKLRRSMMREILSLVADRVSVAATEEARSAVHKAWEMRHQSKLFASADLQVLRTIVQAAQFLPGLWILNQLTTIYVELSKSFGQVFGPPQNYVSTWEEVLALLAKKTPESAIDHLDTYLRAHDETLLALLEPLT